MNKHFDILFNNEDINIITDDNGRPWFLAKDIAKMLGYDKTSNMLRICYDYEIKKIAAKNVGSLSEPTLNTSNLGISKFSPYITLISEPGVYHILYATNHPLTRDFQEWTYNQVMPSIRATGSYMDDAIREYLINNPSVIDEYLLEQEAIGEMWEAYDEEDRIWTENMLRTEYIFDNPYGKPEELLDYE